MRPRSATVRPRNVDDATWLAAPTIVTNAHIVTSGCMSTPVILSKFSGQRKSTPSRLRQQSDRDLVVSPIKRGVISAAGGWPDLAS